MSLFDQRYERAAQVLADADDEVLQSAGLMALMRLETLNRRLRGQQTRKALTPPQLPFSSVFPTPWWQKQPHTGFTFGYNPQQNQTLFGGQGQPLSTFGAHNQCFGSSQPGNTFGASQPLPQAFGSASQTTNSGLFGASQSSPQNTAFGSPQTTVGAFQPLPQNTAFGSSPSANATFSATLPLPQNTTLGSLQTANATFGGPQPPLQNVVFGSAPQMTTSTSFGASLPPPQNVPFGLPSTTDSAAFGASQPPPQNTAESSTNAAAFGVSQPPSQMASGLFSGATPNPLFGIPQSQDTPANPGFGFFNPIIGSGVQVKGDAALSVESASDAPSQSNSAEGASSLQVGENDAISSGVNQSLIERFSWNRTKVPKGKLEK